MRDNRDRCSRKKTCEHLAICVILSIQYHTHLLLGLNVPFGIIALRPDGARQAE